MKSIIFIVCLLSSLSSLAYTDRAFSKNVMLECTSVKSKTKLYILSDDYNAKSDGRINEREFGNLYVTRGPNKPIFRLEQTSKNRWDRALGLYENEDVVLDIRSRELEKMSLHYIHTGERFTCDAQADCC